MSPRVTPPQASWLFPALLLGGCMFQEYRPQPIEPQAFVTAYEQRDLRAPGLRAFMTQCGLPDHPWPRAQWDAAGLECAALYFNPALAQARARIEVAKSAEITAGQRPNPQFNVDVEHHSDTSDDRTPWSIGPRFDLTIEQPARRSARIEGAVARTVAAGIDLDAAIWEARRTARDRTLDVVAARRHRDLLVEQAEALREGVRLLARREEVGLTNSFEVSAMRIEAQRAELARSTAEAKLTTARAALAAAIGLPSAAMQAVSIESADPPGEVLPATAPPPDLLQRQALTGRADIRGALQDYAIAEAGLREQIARQYPDLTLSPGYFFDQTDNIWSLGAALLLPLFNHNEGPIAEAAARRELAARAVEATQAAIIGEVATAYAGYTALRQSALDSVTLIEGLEKQELRLQKQFDAGEIDRLAVVRAHIETMNARVLREELLTETWRGLFRLEDAVQSSLRGDIPRTSEVQAP
jgi:outer membrane protein TolC